MQLQQVRRDLVDGRSVGKHGHFGGGIRRDLRNEFVIFFTASYSYVHINLFKAGFFNLFSATIGTSLETGYNWTETSSETMGELECFEVLATALPGTTLYIEQVMLTTKANRYKSCCYCCFTNFIPLIISGRGTL